MKSNKGFTLVEIIVTIGIMALIGIVIANNMTGLLSEQNDEEYESFKKELENSACIYVETDWSLDTRNSCKRSNNCTITVDELIKSGLIDEETKDPSTGEAILENSEKYSVTIRWNDGVKTCTIKES